jgi:hypothetical protein
MRNGDDEGLAYANDEVGHVDVGRIDPAHSGWRRFHLSFADGWRADVAAGSVPRSSLTLRQPVKESAGKSA